MSIDYIILTGVVALVVCLGLYTLRGAKKYRAWQLEKADKVIESESTIVLTRRESLRLLELIENPPPMNAKLEKLMADYEKGRADDRDSSNKSTHTPAHL